MDFNNATASVIGSSHYKLYYNNQDSYSFYQDRSCIVGVVADGCGSGINSEVGAKLAVDFVVNYCKKHFRYNPFNVDLLQASLIEYLCNIVKNQQTSEELEFIENHLFFTIFGFVIQPQQTFVFHSGDGLYCINDEQFVIDQENRPQYIAKNLISGNGCIETAYIQTHKLQKLLVATDGLMHLNDKFKSGEHIANMTSISDFFDNKDHFNDMISLPKFLTDLSIKKNILKDDTTMIMLKR
jgi:hypothetical protein